MRKIKLYIAISLDGKIAKPDGDVKWLENLPNPEGTDHGYQDFIKDVDATLMGNATYREILGFGIPFPYPDKSSYVFTRSEKEEDTEFIRFVSGDIVDFVKKLKQEKGRDIWLIGGGQINTVLFDADLIDEFQIFVMPIVIGDGIPLFGGSPMEKQLKLVDTKTFSSGAVQLIYHRKS